MVPVACVLLALTPPTSADDFGVEVLLRAEATELRVGEPVLLKVEATNKAKIPLPLAPPLDTRMWNLFFECKPPGDSEYFRLNFPRPSDRSPARALLWPADVKHVSYNYLFRQQVWHGPFTRNPPGNKPRRYALMAEGDWEVRAAVVSGETVYRSEPVTIKVRGTLPKPAAEALDACAESLDRVMSLPTLGPREDAVAEFEKHLDALAGTAAELPVRRAILLAAVVTAKPEDRPAAVEKLKAFREKCSQVQKEYTDLLLGAAYVRAGDLDAARTMLKDLPDPSAIRYFIARSAGR